MKCLRRNWRPRITAHPPGPALRGHCRGAVPQPPSALRNPKPAGPLSLNDIIAFESELTSVVVQEAAPERRVDELIDRAARVLKEVSTVLATDGDQDHPQQQHQQAGAATATRAPPRPAQAAPPAGPVLDAAVSGSSSPLSRALFGGSAQVSEREASITRQALQKTLEGAPVSPRHKEDDSSVSNGSVSNGSSSSSSAGSSRPTAGDGAPSAGAERPAWAQALFSSASTTPATTSTSAAASAISDLSPGRSKGQPSRTTAPPNGGAVGTAAPRGPSAPASTSSASSASPAPKLQPAAGQPRRLAAWAPLAYAEVDLSVPTELVLKSEESLYAQAARAAVLPPLQSVVDLTAAVRPPTRGLDLDVGAGAASAVQEQQQAVSEAVAVSEAEVVQGGALGRRLQDGAGRLADGTRFEKLSGTDTGPDGYVKKWEVLRGVTGDGQVQWEECWWQASNRYGLRELGAFKKGTTETGAAWVEEWKEVLYTHPTNLRLVIERTAHKWARDENADEWEEKWGECYEEAGRVHKWADKWAKAGSNVWHERWGEDYDGRGACQKWTDKWAERLLPDGGQEQWGDKWTETFGHGRGTKHGEVWSSNSGGSRYNRWWNEEHYGDGRVRKWGNSTSGEYWDTVEHMDTYYNPVPHFGFQLAVGHSPQLWGVPLPAPDEGDGTGDDDGLGVGLDRL